MAEASLQIFTIFGGTEISNTHQHPPLSDNQIYHPMPPPPPQMKPFQFVLIDRLTRLPIDQKRTHIVVHFLPHIFFSLWNSSDF